MFKVRLADLVIGIDNHYKYIEDFCNGYIVPNDTETDFTVGITDDTELEREKESGMFDKGYLESLAVYRKISEKILDYNGFLMHSAVLSVNGSGVAFAARSGVGKTTHIRLWKQLLGDKCTIVNGDKPLIRLFDGVAYAYGTPWSGKEGYNKNERVKLQNVCFLSRSEHNFIEEFSKPEAVKKLLYQIYLPPKGDLVFKTMGLLDTMMNSIKVWHIGCNMEIDAAKTVYNKIYG